MTVFLKNILIKIFLCGILYLTYKHMRSECKHEMAEKADFRHSLRRNNIFLLLCGGSGIGERE